MRLEIHESAVWLTCGNAMETLSFNCSSVRSALMYTYWNEKSCILMNMLENKHTFCRQFVALIGRNYWIYVQNVYVKQVWPELQGHETNRISLLIVSIFSIFKCVLVAHWYFHIFCYIGFKFVLESQVVECSIESLMHKDCRSWFICICSQAVSWRRLL